MCALPFAHLASFGFAQIRQAVAAAHEAIAGWQANPSSPEIRARAHVALRNAAEDLVDASLLLAAALNSHSGRNPAGSRWRSPISRATSPPPKTMSAPSQIHVTSGEAMMRTGPGRNYPVSWLYQRSGLPVKTLGAA